MKFYALFNSNKLEQLNLSICEGYNIDIFLIVYHKKIVINMI